MMTSSRPLKVWRVPKHSNLFKFIVTIILILGAGFLYALYMNKDQIALEAIKIVGSFGMGGIGGYSLGRLRRLGPPKD